MKKVIPLGLVASAILLATGCDNATQQHTDSPKTELHAGEVTPPVAEKIPHTTEIHGYTLTDNYHWLRDDTRSDEKVLAHLRQENDYTRAMLANSETLQHTLFEEIKGRIVKDNRSVPVKRGNFYYFNETRGEEEYASYYRSNTVAGTDPMLLLDVNKQAQGHEYYAISSFSVSPDDALMAYSEDTLSRRIYTVKIKDLASGELLDDRLEGTDGDIIWANDNRTLYYIKKDPVSLLGSQVYRHTLGTPQSQDELVYEELDKSYYTGLMKSKDGSQIFITHSSTEASGVSLLSADDPKAEAKRFTPRMPGHEYRIAKLNDWYYIITNRDAVNFKLMKVAADKAEDTANWQTVIDHNPNVKFEDLELFTNHLVYKTRSQGQSELTIRDLANGKEHTLNFNDPAYRISLTGNHMLDNENVRVSYSSMTTPRTTYEIDLNDFAKTQLKQDQVLGEFNPTDYTSERIFVTARDGVQVPVSLVYKKALFKKDGSNPLLQYGYGSYGVTFDPGFSYSRLSLLNRGFVFAIAHIRGSQMLGRPWYEDGKKLHKKNTFNDFIDVTKGLIAQGYGDAKRVYAQGGSAGGLLMGAVINQAPELYHGVHAAVPFVDVINTMLDESLPLTTNEYDEWGNPNDKPYFDYMRSYSPYDQVKAQAYPNLLVTTGLHDSQVQYFEPAKWVAKLREMKTDNHKLLFKIDMDAGHGGASGRFKSIKDTALNYAFFIELSNGKL